jgi:diguanylate cyclase (GGDEF)-like protein
MHGLAPDFLTITVANLLIFAAFTLFCRGVLRFLDDEQSLKVLWITNFIALAVVFYFSEVHDSTAPRIIATSLALAMSRGLTGYKLLQHSHRRTYMRIFGIVMLVFCALNISRLFWVTVYGAPENYLHRGPIEMLPLAANLLYLCLTGLLFMNLINNQLVNMVRSESEQDPLTGILNRRGVERRLKVEVKRIERSGGQLSIALIDIDFFKSINDTAGHRAGDIAIRQVANTISSRLRAYDSLGRFGGDEFLLILPQIPGKDALAVLERIAQAARPLHWHGSSLPITLSIGITEATPGESIAALVSRTDKALYAAKHAGRDCCRLLLRDFQMESPSLNSASFVA